MSKHILESSFINKIKEICDLMYDKGWNERNGGNISYILDDDEIKPYMDYLNQDGEEIKLNVKIPKLKKKYLLVTGTGKYLKNVSKDPAKNLGIIKISDDGKSYKIVWGLKESRPTSELPTHLLCHNARLEQDSKHKLIIHNHATNIEAMSFVEELSDKEVTKALWKIQTESIVVFPEGIGILPWMLCGTDEIGYATAKKMKDYRLVIWAHHGILGSGRDFDEVYGLIETAEKSAELYLKVKPFEIKQEIKDSELIELAEYFKVDYNKAFFE